MALNPAELLPFWGQCPSAIMCTDQQDSWFWYFLSGSSPGKRKDKLIPAFRQPLSAACQRNFLPLPACVYFVWSILDF